MLDGVNQRDYLEGKSEKSARNSVVDDLDRVRI